MKKTVKLSNGIECPTIGIGAMPAKSEDVVYQAIKDGTRLIDTASAYKNEDLVGKGIKKAIDEGIVKREDLFVITKLNINEEKNDPETALKNSLERLQLTYVDLYLDHWPSVNITKDGVKLISMVDTWTKMEKLVESGKTKMIGCSNYNVQSLLIILSFCKIRPTFNEVEFHPYLYQKDLKEFCDKENIKILSYNPIIKGDYCAKSAEIVKEKKLDLFNEDIVKSLTEKYKKTPAQIILNWHLQVGVIPIPGTSNPNRMKENLGALDFKMEEEEYKKLSSFDEKQHRFCFSLPFLGFDIFA
jgi:diketogulonate reductase-like aldo/keto reductase